MYAPSGEGAPGAPVWRCKGLRAYEIDTDEGRFQGRDPSSSRGGARVITRVGLGGTDSTSAFTAAVCIERIR